LGLECPILLDDLFNFWLSKLVEPGLSQGVHCRETLNWVEHEQAFEALDGLWGHLAHVAALERLWGRLGGELEADETWVLIEKLLLVRGELAEDLLNAEKLVDLGLAWE
jgi:hypothetical protein